MKARNLSLFTALALALALALFFLSGCNGPKVTVSPMERAYLADYLMRSDRDELSVLMFEHAYFSREASRGGKSITGGGCGCN